MEKVSLRDNLARFWKFFFIFYPRIQKKEMWGWGKIRPRNTKCFHKKYEKGILVRSERKSVLAQDVGRDKSA